MANFNPVTGDPQYYDQKTGKPWTVQGHGHTVEVLERWLVLCQEATDKHLGKPIRSRLTQRTLGVCTAVYHIKPGTFARLLISDPNTGTSRVFSTRVVEVAPTERLTCAKCECVLTHAAPKFHHPDTDENLCFDCYTQAMGPSDDWGDYADARRDR